MAKRENGSTNKDLYLSEPRLTTRGVENIALLEEVSVNQTDSRGLDTIPTTLHQYQEKDDNQIEGNSNVDNDVDCLASVNRDNIDLH